MNENHDPANGQFAEGQEGAHAAMDRNTNVANHANTLTDHMGDNDKFDHAMAKLEGDKTVGKNEMRQIAMKVLGRTKLKSSIGRAGALKEIRTRQMLNMRADHRMAEIERHMKSW